MSMQYAPVPSFSSSSVSSSSSSSSSRLCDSHHCSPCHSRIPRPNPHRLRKSRGKRTPPRRVSQSMALVHPLSVSPECLGLIVAFMSPVFCVSWQKRHFSRHQPLPCLLSAVHWALCILNPMGSAQGLFICSLHVLRVPPEIFDAIHARTFLNRGDVLSCCAYFYTNASAASRSDHTTFSSGERTVLWSSENTIGQSRTCGDDDGRWGVYLACHAVWCPFYAAATSFPLPRIESPWPRALWLASEYLPTSISLPELLYQLAECSGRSEAPRQYSPAAAPLAVSDEPLQGFPIP